MELQGATWSEPRPTNPLPGVSSYFQSPERSKWISGVKHWGRIVYEQVYPGIDLHFYPSGANLEYDFVVSPSADPSRIRMTFPGATSLALENGDLAIAAGNLRLRHRAPSAAQHDGRPVPASLAIQKDIVTIRLGSYDTTQELTIDPVVEASTLLGGDSGDHITAMAVDPAGNIVVAGSTSSSVLGGKQTEGSMFVAKLTPDLRTLLFLTFFGTSTSASPEAIAIDSAGGIVLAGHTFSGGIPTTSGVLQPSPRTSDPNQTEGFVLKLDTSGTQLLLSTYLSSSNNDRVWSVALDADSNIYLAGHTTYSDFPSIDIGFLSTPGARSGGFALKLDPSATRLLYSAFFSTASLHRIVVYPNGAALVVGLANQATHLPTTPGVIERVPTASSNARYLAKLVPGGRTLEFASFYGSLVPEYISDAAIDADGNIYLASIATDAQHPVTSTSPLQPRSQGGSLITKLSPDASALKYSVLLGDSLWSFRIAVEPSGTAHFSGYTTSNQFALAGSPLITRHAEMVPTAAIGRLSPEGVLRDSTFWTGHGERTIVSGTFASAIAILSPGNVLIAGKSVWGSFPTTDGALQTDYGGFGDAYITRISYTSQCTYAIDPPAITMPPSGGSMTLNIETAPGCNWVASPADRWIETEVLSRSQLRVVVPPSTGGRRTGAVFVAGNSVPVTQEPNCTYDLSLNTPVVQPQGGNFLVSLLTGQNCPWSLSSSQDWLRVPAALKIGPTSVSVFVDVNHTRAPRTASLSVGPGANISIRQQGSSCSYNVTPATSQAFPSRSTVAVTVDTAPECPWSALSDANWLTHRQFSALGPQFGSRTLDIAVAKNEGAARTATVRIAGQSIAITQPASIGSAPDVSSVLNYINLLRARVDASAQDADGATDIARVYFLVHTKGAAEKNTCHGFYDRTAGALYLFNDALSIPMGPLAFGSNAALTNSQCALRGENSSHEDALNRAGLVLDLELSRSFASRDQSVYLWAVDRSGNHTGWIQSGQWLRQTPAPPRAPMIVPSFNSHSLVGTNGTIRFQVEDPNGLDNISRIYFLVNSEPSVPANSCHGFYDKARNEVFLYDDSLSSLLGPLHQGTPNQTPIGNSQCSLRTFSYFVPGYQGATGNFTLDLDLKGSFAEKRHNVYGWAVDTAGDGSGWVQTANWNPIALGHFPAFRTQPSLAASGTNPFRILVDAEDEDGVANLVQSSFLIGGGDLSLRNACHITVSLRTDAVQLTNDAGTAPVLPDPGDPLTLRNSQCEVDTRTLQVRRGGDYAEVSLFVRFIDAFNATARKIHASIRDEQGNDTGWLLRSVRDVSTPPLTQPPTILSTAPAAPQGSPQQFTFQIQDLDGHSDLNRVYFLVNADGTIPANTCHGLYDKTANAVFLYSDGLTNLSSLQNSQCTVTAFSASASGTTLTLNLTLSLRGQFAAAAKNVYLWATDRSEKETGWVQVATWSPVAPPAPPTVVSATPANPAGSPQVFHFKVQDPNGAANIQRVYLLVEATPSTPRNTCHGFFDGATNRFLLYDDTLTSLASLQNSQCAVTAAAATTAGTELTLTVTMALSGTFAATPKNIYLWVVDNDGNGTGWVKTGTWTPSPNRPPVVLSNPQSAHTGPSSVIPFTAQDSDGAANIARLYFLVNASSTISANTCHGFYDRAAHGLFLYNDALTTVAGPLTPGQPGVLQNNQCSIDAAATTVTPIDGFTLRLNLALSLVPAYRTDPKSVFLWIRDTQNTDTGWVRTGTWIPAVPSVVIAGVPTLANSAIQVAITARHPDGFEALSRIYFLANPTPQIPQKTCHGFFDRKANTVFLYNDDLTGFSPNLRNSSCTVQLVNAFSSGTDLTVSLAITGHKPSNTGYGQNLYVWPVDERQQGTGWVRIAEWLIP